MNENKVLTVSKLTKYIRGKFTKDRDLRDVRLIGELSNFRIQSSGHSFFTLKDENSQIEAVMFKSQLNRLKFQPKNGMNVKIYGKVDVYEAHGKYRFYANRMVDDGLGNLFIAYENLKKKLKNEGLFHKKPKIIPKFPKKIGIITSSSGAAAKDIIVTIKRRWPLVEMTLYPTIVQGNNAKESIEKNIHLANNEDFDVLIIGRGGGNMEDLWAFNEEIVIRAIANSKIPIVSAIGHETDNTLSDCVSDLDLPTPTAAAEYIVPNKITMENNIKNFSLQLNKIINNQIYYLNNDLKKIKNHYLVKNPETIYKDKVERLGILKGKSQDGLFNQIKLFENTLKNINCNYILRNPSNLYDNKAEKVDVFNIRLYSSIDKYFDNIENNLNLFKNNHTLKNPEKIYDFYLEKISRIKERLNNSLKNNLKIYENDLNLLREKLLTLNPSENLKRKYVIEKTGEQIAFKQNKIILYLIIIVLIIIILFMITFFLII